MSGAAFSVDVRDILDELGGIIELDTEFDTPDITLGDEVYAPVTPARLKAVLANTGAGIVLTGSVDVDVRAACSRCLVEFNLPVHGELEGFYVAHGDEAEIPEEQDVAFIEEARVDIMPAIQAALAISVPLAPVHSEECAGICPHCGADLNAGPCACEPDRSDSPFAVLKDMLPQE